jgi:hypothetical protein
MLVGGVTGVCGVTSVRASQYHFLGAYPKTTRRQDTLDTLVRV